MKTTLTFILLLIICTTDVKKDYIDGMKIPLYQIISTGQSVSVGTKSTPAISTQQPYNNLMLHGRTGGEGNGYFLEPLYEARWETPSSAMANTLTKMDTNLQIVIGLHGQNATEYDRLKKGTALYKKGLSQIQTVHNIAQKNGRQHIVIATTLIHGETDDCFDISSENYEQYIVEMQHDKEQAAQNITGQKQSVPLFTCQTSSFSSDYYVNKKTSDIPIAQLNAAIHNSDKIFCVTPRYLFTYDEDGAHMDGLGSEFLGEYYGKVIKRVVFDDEDWKPLMPISITLKDSIVVIDYHVPRGHIVIDTNHMVKHNNYGFEFYGDTNTTICAIKITKKNQIQITLSGIPTGKRLQVGYAYTADRGAHSGPNNPSAIGGNIHDTDMETGLSGRPLYNWAVQGIWKIIK